MSLRELSSRWLHGSKVNDKTDNENEIQVLPLPCIGLCQVTQPAAIHLLFIQFLSSSAVAALRYYDLFYQFT